MNEPPVVLFLVLLTVGVSIAAFRNSSLREKLIFRPDAILAGREYYRLLSCALIHLDAVHLIFNVLAFYSFGRAIEFIYGGWVVLLIYTLSALGGSLLSLFAHRNHVYRALGASGGVCGVIFATIFMVPGTSVGILFIPFYFPGWLFATVYLVLTFIALRRGVGSIGHDAHFGGAVVGMALAAIFAPSKCLANPYLFFGSIGFSLFCLFVIWRDPTGIGGFGFSRKSSSAPRRGSMRYQAYDDALERGRRKREIDALLDKVAQRGIDSLTDQERERLKKHSQRMRRR